MREGERERERDAGDRCWQVFNGSERHMVWMISVEARLAVCFEGTSSLDFGLG